MLHFFILDIFSVINEFPMFGFPCFPDLPVCLPLTFPFAGSPLSHRGNPAVAELFLMQCLSDLGGGAGTVVCAFTVVIFSLSWETQ